MTDPQPDPADNNDDQVTCPKCGTRFNDRRHSGICPGCVVCGEQYWHWCPKCTHMKECPGCARLREAIREILAKYDEVRLSNSVAIKRADLGAIITLRRALQEENNEN